MQLALQNTVVMPLGTDSADSLALVVAQAENVFAPCFRMYAVRRVWLLSAEESADLNLFLDGPVVLVKDMA